MSKRQYRFVVDCQVCGNHTNHSWRQKCEGAESDRQEKCENNSGRWVTSCWVCGNTADGMIEEKLVQKSECPHCGETLRKVNCCDECGFDIRGEVFQAAFGDTDCIHCDGMGCEMCLS